MQSIQELALRSGDRREELLPKDEFQISINMAFNLEKKSLKFLLNN
jgi:hypothetical protein